MKVKKMSFALEKHKKTQEQNKNIVLFIDKRLKLYSMLFRRYINLLKVVKIRFELSIFFKL